MTSKRHLIEGDVLRVAKAGAAVGVRRGLNLVEGANVTLTVADNGADDRVDVTVAATAAGVTQASIEAALTHISFGDGVIKVNATPVLGSQQGAIASLGPTASLADARAAVNAIIAALHAHGLIA